MLREKIKLFKVLLSSLTPFIALLGAFCIGFIFGKLLINHEDSKFGKKLTTGLFVLGISLIGYYTYKGFSGNTILDFKLLLFSSIMFGLIARIGLHKTGLKKAKGEIHSKSKEFYLGKSSPLHNQYKYGLENKVVKSAILTHHQLIYGASGSGKTFSTLQPQCYFDVKWKRRLFIIDPKGDLDFSNSVYSYAKHFDRESDFFFFSITNPTISHSFNPLLSITSNEIKDLLISCTEWSEPYYKKMAEMLLLEILEDMVKPTLSKIEKRIPDEMEYKGLKADLKIMSKSDFGKLIDNEDAPSLEDLHENNNICFFSLNTQSYPEASKQLGRIILGALMALSNKIQSTTPKPERKETTVIVDEFGSFITETFINFLNKARSSKFRLILATQSTGDVELDGQKTRKQVADSTTVKMFLRVSDPDSAEYCSSVVGTHSVTKRTSRIDDRNFISDTHTGSIRDVQEFIIHPDEIKKFDVGEGVLYTQAPFSISRVKFDFSNHYKIEFFNYIESNIAKKRILEFQNDSSSMNQPVETQAEPITDIKDNIAEFSL